jgi:glucose-1-phosphate thymidylyltransferase
MRSKDKMKGVILAGGLGSRLAPCTLVTNKHLLPVYDKPMIYYPLGTLIQAGITDILIVTGGQFAGDFLKLLGNGKEFGLKHLNYTYQEGEGGIADALSLAEYFVGDERVCVILGDNLIQGNIVQAVQEFEKQESGARVLLKEVEDIVEKPKNPVSNYAVTGIYFYDQQVFSMIKNLEPSARGELEITDVNNMYLDKNQLEYDILEGWWTDAGTFNSLHRASNLVAETGANLLKL